MVANAYGQGPPRTRSASRSMTRSPRRPTTSTSTTPTSATPPAN